MRTRKFFTIFLVISSLLAISGSATADLTTGLIAYYPFNSNANDESGNNHDGTIYGATLTTDRFGKADSAYSFDGTTNYIDTFSLNDVSVFSFSVWAYCYPNYSGTDWRDIFSGDNGNADRALLIDTNNHIIVFDGHSGIDTGTLFKNGIWGHFVVNFTDTDILLYLNGTKIWNAGHAANGWSEGNWHIGNAAWNGGSHHFYGKIDDLRIYNRILAVSEIQQLYQEGSSQHLGVAAIPDVNGDGMVDQAVLTQSAGKYYLTQVVS